jgi:endonuclease/exonuclease/phosphatase family metal-dependent hydrolase
MSFNIRAALSSSIEEIADLVATENPDIVALQEVDVGVERSGRVDQPSVVAARLGARYAFAQTLRREGGAYGVALLSRLPFARVDRIDLDAAGAFERRVAIDADVCVGARAVRVVATHADIFPWSLDQNVRDIEEAVGTSSGRGLVVAGDLNMTPDATPVERLKGLGLLDVIGQHAEGPTFLDGGDRRLDYVFADLPLTRTTDGKRVGCALSDHLPIVVDLSLTD